MYVCECVKLKMMYNEWTETLTNTHFGLHVRKSEALLHQNEKLVQNSNELGLSHRNLFFRRSMYFTFGPCTILSCTSMMPNIMISDVFFFIALRNKIQNTSRCLNLVHIRLLSTTVLIRNGCNNKTHHQQQ